MVALEGYILRYTLPQNYQWAFGAMKAPHKMTSEIYGLVGCIDVKEESVPTLLITFNTTCLEIKNLLPAVERICSKYIEYVEPELVKEVGLNIKNRLTVNFEDVRKAMVEAGVKGFNIDPFKYGRELGSYKQCYAQDGEFSSLSDEDQAEHMIFTFVKKQHMLKYPDSGIDWDDVSMFILVYL